MSIYKKIVMKNENFEGKIKEKGNTILGKFHFSLPWGATRALHIHTHPYTYQNNKKNRHEWGWEIRKNSIWKKKFFFLVPSSKIYVEINFVRDYWMWKQYGQWRWWKRNLYANDTYGHMMKKGKNWKFDPREKLNDTNFVSEAFHSFR